VVQASYIFFHDVQPTLKFIDVFFRRVNLLLSRELGLQSLDEYSFGLGVDHTEMRTCCLFLSQPFNPFASWHREPDYFCKTRLSMLEILFREAEALVRKGYVPAALARNPVDGSKVKTVMTEAIKELKRAYERTTPGSITQTAFFTAQATNSRRNGSPRRSGRSLPIPSGRLSIRK
jgi:hypothetical protein